MATDRVESRSLKASPLGLSLPLTIRHSKNLKFGGETYSNAIGMTGRFTHLMSSLRESEPLPDTGDSTEKHNRERYNDVVFASGKSPFGFDRDEFAGGSFKKLLAPHEDFSPYHEALSKLSQQKVWKSAIQSFAEISVRKRKRCAYDGEFDYDKRWDAEPFQRRTAAPRTQRIVKMIIQCGVNCMVSAESIARFAGFAAAIAQLLERNGVMVEIETNYVGTGFANTTDSNIYVTNLTVKRADEYLPPGQILKAMSPNFFRRAIFGTIVVAAQTLNAKVDGGLGRSYNFSKVFGVEGNTLVLYSAPNEQDQGKVIEELIKLIGAAPKDAPEATAKTKTEEIVVGDSDDDDDDDEEEGVPF